jgi:hypothetical protein
MRSRRYDENWPVMQIAWVASGTCLETEPPYHWPTTNPHNDKEKATYLNELLGINLASGACTDLLNNSTNVVIVAADTSLLASVLNFFGIKVTITI